MYQSRIASDLTTKLNAVSLATGNWSLGLAPQPISPTRPHKDRRTMPGFQLLSLVPHSVSFERAGVRVFQQASRGSNMMLSVKQAFPHAFRFAIQTGRPTASAIASDTNTASDGELNLKASPDKGAAAGKLTGAETLKLAKKLLGSRVLVGWPHTYLAMVESISSEMTTYT